MKVNSELPLCMLKENNQINEFDFVLLHLLVSNPDYRQWAYDQRRLYPGRLMILDNSAYEFFVKGEELDLELFAKYINDLQPDYYILPDVLRDNDKTLSSTKEFLEKYNIESRDIFNPLPLVVTQGNTDQELTLCLFEYQAMELYQLCIPFHIDAFRDMKGSVDKDIRDLYIKYYNEQAEVGVNDDLEYSMGRVQWVRNHLALLGLFRYIHFLGSHCPLEKKLLNELIPHATMDTGYPVKLAVEGGVLFEEKKKPNIIIDDFLDTDLTNETKELIRKNVEIFKNL